MAISSGGVLGETGLPGEALRALIKRVAKFKPRSDDGDFVVDLAFRSWEPWTDPEFVGVQAGAVGRKQRRVIIWHGVPRGMSEEPTLARWFAECLRDTECLLRDWLPTKSRAYPAEQLADEVAELRTALLSDLGDRA